MLHVVLRHDYPSLVNELVPRLLAERSIEDPLARAMAREWVVTPSTGTKQWLTRELSRQIGATPGGTDGIVANWLHEFPSRLSGRILDAHLLETTGLESDPWALPQLQFTLLRWAQEHPHHPAVTALTSGGSSPLLARARYYADLFDRYHLWRPDMIVAWRQGDRATNEMEEVVQQQLWKAVREYVGIESPPERFAAAFDFLDANPDILPASDRLSIFGLTAFPGGERFVEVLERLGKHLDCTIYLVDGFEEGTVPGRENEEGFSSTLLRLWGGAPVANAPLIANLEALASSSDRLRQPLNEPTTLLEGLQYTLRTDTVKPVSGGDASVVEHRCFGPQRQAEVLRDALRHDLEKNPSWREEDLLVVCPDLTTFGPLIRTAFGPSRRGPSKVGDAALAYRIFDATGVDGGLHVQALRHLLRLMSSQFTRSDVLSFLAEPDVRRRRRLSPEDHEYVSAWTKDAGIRWGLDGDHRGAFGLSSLGDINTWSTGLDRLQLGFMVENPSFRAVGDLLPVDVSGSKFELLSNVSNIIEIFIASYRETTQDKTLSNWLLWFDDLTAELIRADHSEYRQVERIHQAIGSLRSISEHEDVLLTYSDFSSLLDETLSTAASIGALFTGGITITSPDTLRWVPFTATYLVGFDDGSFLRPDLEIDDLRRMDPRPGEILPNDDARSRLSELVLSTRERLTVFRTSHDLSTGEELDPPIAFSEFVDGVLALHGDSSLPTGAFLPFIQHPRNGFDQRNFLAGETFETARSLNLMDASWSFDPEDESLARVTAGVDRLQPRDHDVNHIEAGSLTIPPRITVGELKRFIENPPASFLKLTLGISLTDDNEERIDSLDGEFTNLMRSTTLRKVFEAAVNQGEGDTRVFMHGALDALASSGDLPPQPILPVDEVVNDVDLFVEKWRSCTNGATRKSIPIDLSFGATKVMDHVTVFERGDQVHVVEAITSRAKFHKLIGPWIKALFVQASLPDASVTLTIIVRPDAKNDAIEIIEISSGPDGGRRAHDALNALAQLFAENLSSPLMFELEDFTSKAGDSTVERGGALGENNDPLNLTFPAPPIGDEKWAGRSFTGFPTTKYLKNPAWRAVFSDITAADLAQIPRIVAHRASVHERFGQIFAQPFYLHSVLVTPTKGANGEK